MFKVKVTENFTLKDYESIKDIEMNGEKCDVEITEKGAKFLPNMTFVCNADMLEYLMGGNRLKKKFVEVINEIIDAEIVFDKDLAEKAIESSKDENEAIEKVVKVIKETAELKEIKKKRKSRKKKD